jgi:hypothetical protein
VNAHPIGKLILEALVSTPEGFTLDESKAPKILELLAKSAQRNDPTAAKAFYELVGLLQHSNGAPAAAALLNLMMSTVEAASPPTKAGWRTRA